MHELGARVDRLKRPEARVAAEVEHPPAVQRAPGGGQQRREEVLAAQLLPGDAPVARDGRCDPLAQLEAVVPAREGRDPLLEFLGVHGG